ncbi:MAG: FAD-binding protein, partial [Candidatus Binataceae bacterium]
MAQYDVIVIGAGNAALAASVSARGAGAEHVLVLEKAPEHDRGGNTHFSGGLFRFAFNQPGDLLRLVPKAREVEGFMEGIEAYPTDAFREDLARVTDGRTDPELSQILIANSYETVCWMAEQGIAFELALSL